MSAPAYVALAWPPGAEAGAALRRRLAGAPPHPCVFDGDGLAVWSDAPPGRIHRLADGVVLGALHPGLPPGLGAHDRLAPARLARRLVDGAWGRYLALLRPSGGPAAVFRDPSGQVGALAWPLEGGVWALASGVAAAPAWLRPPGLAPDWDAVAAFLAEPVAHTATSLFCGVTAIVPGQLARLGSAGLTRETIWSPAQAAAGEGPPTGAAAAALVEAVDRATAALVGSEQRILVELSGGLDSSILAGTLAELGACGRVAAWLNFHGDRAEGDERAYARAVTERLGMRLTEIAKPLTPLTAADLAELADASWPAINGVEAARDRAEAALIAAHGAGAILSGQGGDAVFYQPPEPLMLDELWAARGPALLAAPELRALAQRLRRPVWSILAILADHQLRPRPLPVRVSALAAAGARAAAAGTRHPWLDAAWTARLPASRRVQIAGLATAQLLHGESRRSRAADLLFPLLAQPVVELCLTLPTALLGAGVRDRPLARGAFAERLPPEVRDRRAKGDLNAIHGRLVAASLPMLRPYLLDGVLAARGVVDRPALARALDVGQLIWTGGATELLWAAVTEAWARHWAASPPP